MTTDTEPHNRRATDNGDRPITKTIVRWVTWAVMTCFIIWQAAKISDAQQKTKLANERLYRIFHGALKPIVMCDDEGHIVEYNKSAEEMFGWTRDEMMGKDVSVLIPEKYRPVHKAEFLRAIVDLKAADADWRIVRTGMHGSALTKAGKVIPVTFATRGIRYGDNIEFLASFNPGGDDAIPKVEAGPLELPRKGPP